MVVRRVAHEQCIVFLNQANVYDRLNLGSHQILSFGRGQVECLQE
jgi:hypothetical protein